MTRRFAFSAGLIGGVALDALVGDPVEGHPVAAFGRAANAVERRLWRDARAPGAVFATTCVGVAVACGGVVERAARGRCSYPIVIAAATWVVLGGETLCREATFVRGLLERDELPAARDRLTHLVGRDTSLLDKSEIARAAVESIAENTCDAVVAPLVWGALAGVPGLLGYRAVNTLDAMVGNKSARYRRFGWAAARLDDAANLAPARFTALLVGLVGGARREVWRVVRRDAHRHPSPNSGWCEAAYAGSLGLRLGGVNVYGDRVEERPTLGDGRPAEPRDIQRAARLCRRVTWSAAAGAAVAAIVVDR